MTSRFKGDAVEEYAICTFLSVNSFGHPFNIGVVTLHLPSLPYILMGAVYVWVSQNSLTIPHYLTDFGFKVE